MKSRLTASAFRHFDRVQTNMAAAMMPAIAARTLMVPVTDPASTTFGESMVAPLTVKAFDGLKFQRAPFSSSILVDALAGGR
jgi:hypothetical protein